MGAGHQEAIAHPAGPSRSRGPTRRSRGPRSARLSPIPRRSRGRRSPRCDAFAGLSRMWILVRGIRVDHGARACPQSHDDHVRRDCHYVRRDCNPSDPMWVARLHGGVARLRPSPLYVHRARVRHPHTSICHVPRSLHSPWGYEPPGIPHSRRQLCRGRFSATGTSSSRCAYPTARPVAIRPLCDNNDNKKKK